MKKIDALVAKLLDPDEKVRDQAAAELLKYRVLAVPALQKAAKSGDSDLSGENHTISDLGGPSEANLGAKQRVLTDVGAVSHLHQIINLCTATDAGLFHAGAIYA